MILADGSFCFGSSLSRFCRFRHWWRTNMHHRRAPLSLSSLSFRNYFTFKGTKANINVILPREACASHFNDSLVLLARSLLSSFFSHDTVSTTQLSTINRLLNYLVARRTYSTQILKRHHSLKLDASLEPQRPRRRLGKYSSHPATRQD